MPKDKLETAAKSGDAEAQFALANWFVQNKSSKRQASTDATDAAMWYRRAAEQGHSNAQYRLGLAYGEGDGVIEDWHEAAKWFQKAAAQGNAWAQYRLGQCYKQGKGVIESRDEAVKWFRRAADLNHDEARATLSRMKVAVETEVEMVVPVFLDREACAASEVTELITREPLPMPAIPEQDNKKHELTSDEKFELGCKFVKEFKFKDAHPLFLSAAEAGHVGAHVECGKMYSRWSNDVEAFRWFRKGADLNSLEAQVWLALWHEAGVGTPQDFKEAARWYRVAAERGDATAQFILGKFYAHGRGVNQDFEQAQIWFDKAAKQGSKMAKAVQAEVASLSQKNQAVNARRPPSGRVVELGSLTRAHPEHAMTKDTQSKPDYMAMVFVALFFLFVMSAQLGKDRGIISSFFLSGFVTFMFGLPLYFGIKALLKYCGSVVSESGVFRRHLPFYLMLLGVILGSAYFNTNKPTYYPPIPPPVSRPVQVDSYYRSDGTYVSPHDRAPPGEKAAYDHIDLQRSDAWMRRMGVVIGERNKVRLQAWLIFLGFAGTGGLILWRRHRLG